MPHLQDSPSIIGQDGFTATVAQNHKLGTRAMDRSGRVFRYARAGAADLVAGTVLQSPAVLTAYLAMTPSAAAIGATAVPVTPGATAAVANLFAEGQLSVDTTPGNGFTYIIASHPAFAGSDLQTITLANDDTIQVALTSSSRVGVMHNPYQNVIICPTTKTAAIVGVAAYVIPTTQYGWIQTWGPASVLINGTPAVTAPVINSATTAGAVDVWTAAAQPTASYLGEMMQVGVSTKNNLVFLKINP